MTAKIKSLLKWSDPKRIETKFGPKDLHVATPTAKFWNTWKHKRTMLKEAGVSVGKSLLDNSWEVCWWKPVSEEEQQEMAEAVEDSRATESDIDVPCPKGLEYMPFQLAGIAYALDRRDTLLADQMGLGKSIEAIGVWNVDDNIAKTLIICPASLRLNWKREFLKWAVRSVRVAIVNGGKPTDFPEWNLTWDVLIINYDVIGKHRDRIDKFLWDLLIIDESQFLKNPNAKRTLSVLGGKDIKPIKARRKLFLSGTPIVNRPIELWPLLRSLDPQDLGSDYWRYARRYCDAKKNHFGWDVNGASRLDELQTKLRSKFMVRRLKKDVLTELPAKRRQVIELPANGAEGLVRVEMEAWESHQAYIEERGEATTQAELKKIQARFSDEEDDTLGMLSRLRHETALAKMTAVIEHLESALENGPVVCFAHHRDVIEQIKEYFGGRAVKITGDTCMKDRQMVIDWFQDGKRDLLIGNIQAAGVGITLTRSSHVVFAELDWVGSNLSQAEDRCHRIGQRESVLVQHLVLENSLDAMMVRKLIAKQEVIDQALDRPANEPSV